MLCKTWNEYFENFHDCRTTGAVDRLTTFLLSFVPFTGLNNFYRRDPVTGFYELMNGIMMILCITVLGICHNPNARRYNHEASFWAVFIGIAIAFLDLAKVMQMVDDNGSVDKCEILVIFISIMIVLVHCTQMEYSIISTFTVTFFVTGMLETLRDIFTAGLYTEDGTGCPFA